jgi:branched-chain amino acid transport system substrate-binding protein
MLERIGSACMARSLVWLALAFVGACAPAAPAAKRRSAPPVPVAVKPPAPVPAATETPAAARPWKIGVLLPFTGPEAALAAHTREGIQVAVDATNERGGPRGRRVELVYTDDASNVQLAAERTAVMIDRDQVIAVLGELASSRSLAAGIVANRKGVPLISPSSTNPAVTKVGPFVFRTCVVDDVQGRIAARFVVSGLGKKRVAVLYGSDVVYSKLLADVFVEEAKRLGAQVVAKQSFLQADTSFTPQLAAIARARADIVYAPTYYVHMIQIARQMTVAGLRGDRFVGADGWDSPELLRDAGDVLEGAYLTNHWVADAPWPASRRFVADYQARFKREPDTLAATGHDAALVLADALARSHGDDGYAVREALSESRNVEGVTGTISLDADRNAAKPMSIVRIQRKAFTFHNQTSAE